MKIMTTSVTKASSEVRLYVDRHNTNAQKVYQKLGMEECHYLMYEASVNA